MKKLHKAAICLVSVFCILLSGCSGSQYGQPQHAAVETTVVEQTETSTELVSGVSDTETVSEAAVKTTLPDGIYTAEFDTDNSMFRVNEAHDGKGILTVEDGEMMLHVTLGSKNIVKLYPGFSEVAKTDESRAILPTEDSVTYSDGWTETAYGFDIPVPVLDEEFALALIGKKGKWYDHKVRVSNPEPYEEKLEESSEKEETKTPYSDTNVFYKSADGLYTVELTLEGGSGKSEILSPTPIFVSADAVTATIQWDSPNYDYMIVDGETYMPVNTDGNSVFEIPVLWFDEPMTVIGDTVAMSRPHEIEYTITFHSDSVKEAE